MKFRTDINTGKTFRRTHSNFPHYSIGRAKILRIDNRLNAIKGMTDHGSILSLACAMADTGSALTNK